MIENPYKDKRDFFDKGNSKSYEFRLRQLNKLKKCIHDYEDQIIRAMAEDLGKPEFESYTAEIGMVYTELNHAIKKLRSWMKAKKVATPIYLQPARSHVYFEPKGVILIISPWNYPFQLVFSPLIGAIAAGNCVVLKPSHKSKSTEKIIGKIIEDAFNKDYISLVKGPGSEVVPKLIENYRFDHIFFTGSVDVGKKIASMAAKDLTPLTLELGGKSPVIVDEDADIDLSAKRITWAKFYNCGQTCVAPDYLLVHESKKDVLIDRMKYYMKSFFGNEPRKSESLGRIIDEKSFNRLVGLLKNANIIEGGDFLKEEKYISPSLIDGVSLNHPIMQEEIFGPILPILSYSNISEVLSIVKLNPYPLALYLFTKDRKLEDYILENIQFGGGSINHLILHVANSNLPFGGIGSSGMGKYHSKYSFITFSHEKAIFKSKGKLDPNFLYPPYKKNKLKLARKFMP